MSEMMDLKAAAADVLKECREAADELKNQGIVPCLAILRVGEKGPDLSYEKGATKTMAEAGIEVKSVALPADVSQEEYIRTLDSLSADKSIHGILTLRPLDNIDENEAIGRHLDPLKDVDCCTAANMGKVVVNDPTALFPCTAGAVFRIIETYAGPELQGKNICIVNNSNVIGKPLSMMLTNRYATVSVIHHLTTEEDKIRLASQADILVTAVPFKNTVGAEMVKEGAMVIDASVIREKVFDETGAPVMNEKTGKQKVATIGCLTADAKAKAGLLSPVPGVGGVTSAMLAGNLIKACKLAAEASLTAASEKA
jgi:methylenetetrahydrofolate dehydrogenase (NADP+)/methenyltetrahydrofolate cyclohydrolase